MAMKVVVTKSYDESCAYVADMICKLVNEKPACKLGLATGGTPVPMYKKLIEANKAGKVDFSAVRTVNLDEYCGIPGTHDQSYRYFMDSNLFDHNNIDKANPYVAKGLWRGRVTYALDTLNACVRPQLLHMLSWLAGTRTGFAVSAGKSGADLPAYLPAGCWERYLSIYADAEPGHVWAAVFAAATLFLDAAHQTAEALALPVNEAEAEGSLRYLYRVRELPADASEIF